MRLDIPECWPDSAPAGYYSMFIELYRTDVATIVHRRPEEEKPWPEFADLLRRYTEAHHASKCHARIQTGNKTYTVTYDTDGNRFTANTSVPEFFKNPEELV